MLPIRTLLLFLMACLSISHVDAGEAVIELTSRTFDSSIKDGSVWLIEFYAPWCGHCKTFAPSYEEVAQALHGLDEDRKIKVARINGDKERAITSRFGIRGFPQFFLVEGWSVYEYDGSRSAPKLIEWAKGGYLKNDALPWLTSPMGPMGLLQGLLMQAGTRAIDVYEWLTMKKGMSPVTVVCVLCIGGVMFSVVSMIILTIVLTSKPKED